MNNAPDRIQRKHEIGKAFLQAAHLPHETDVELYRSLLEQIGVTSERDISILCSIVQDAIMTAVREERPTTPLDTFLDWLVERLVLEEGDK